MFKNFIALIHENKFTTTIKLFYIEIRLDDYNWIKSKTFPQIFNEITNFYAFKTIEYNLTNKGKNLLTADFPNIFKNAIEEKREKILNTKISYSDLKRFHSIFDKSYRSSYSSETRHFLFRYWKFSENKFNSLPSKRFLKCYKTDRSAENIDKIICKIYHTRKGYKDINNNRFDNQPSNISYDYSNKYLNIWKQIYEDNLRQIENYREECYQIIDDVKKPDPKDHLICENCSSDLDFEKKTTSKIPEDHIYLCTNCYLERYFERI